ncbi:bifunctional 4-hydroxy-2-oxoglutarate aldolase/2-dehydro-3-deoxy-phosphogluconate aldolase [Pseudonocardia sp. TRM90224]|uniref:bifunctional 4-hydroxy-2-oxoglutarate aldolase/2-dehydro-3-deoxy-phosphogluconate aldolase n=1 Tax=Pseudonocardia sp. TRM90224 TaxID=2812678 RepID=UPI001E44C915|nr:bifunctional 4-hydroxy-2-oxoglutarate aldolase/2-dehydro-3-deoxy-phosphogluconate aldolase [Pseudonocardia sp. TRM90224]
MTHSSRPDPGHQLVRTRIIAILRSAEGSRVAEALDVLVDAGITCLEITMNTPGALAAVTAARERHGDAVEVGVGTVRTAEQARAAAEAGAQFVVAPGTSAAVAEAAHAAGLRWYPGAFTATEAERAWELGAAAVKLFPASLGGPRYLREVRAPLDDIPFVPTGGVALDDIPAYLEAGAIAVGLGSPLLGDALLDGPLDALRERAEKAISAARRVP